MRIKKIIIIFIIGIFCSIAFSNMKITAKDIKVKICSDKVKESKEYMDIDLNIPQVKITNNLTFESKINNVICSDINTWKNDLIDLAKKYKEDFEKANAQWKPFVLNIKYNDPYNKNNLLSLVLDYYQYTGGAHGLTTRIAYNFALNEEKSLELKDIFKLDYDYKLVINNLIKNEIQKNSHEYFNNGENFNGIKENTDFYFSEQGIVIYFQLYDIAPYSSGIKEFLVPYELLKNGFIYNISY